MKRSGSIRNTVIAAAVCLAAFFAWRYYAGKSAAPRNLPVAVITAPVEIKDVPLEFEAVGNVVPFESVAVKARLDSQVMEVHVRDGQNVNAGDLLFLLDDRSLTAQLLAMQANVKRDQAQLENFKQQYTRSQQLKRQGFVSQEQLEQAKATYEAQAATLASTVAGMKNLGVQLEYTQIRAPITGRAGTINITLGNTVKANDSQPLVTINQIKPIRAQISLPQKNLDRVRDAMAAGQVTATATHEGGSKPSQGSLDYLDNAIDPASGTFAARASFPNADESLWPGMFVNVRLMVGADMHAVTVPEVAVQHGQSGDYVFTVEHAAAHKVAVTVSRNVGDTAVIATGLKAGDIVVIDGVLSLKDKGAVTVHAPGGDKKSGKRNKE